MMRTDRMIINVGTIASEGKSLVCYCSSYSSRALRVRVRVTLTLANFLEIRGMNSTFFQLDGTVRHSTV